MINASQIKEHMTVKGSDGKHVGTVLGVENGRLRLASGGMDHGMWFMKRRSACRRRRKRPFAPGTELTHPPLT